MANLFDQPLFDQVANHLGNRGARQMRQPRQIRATQLPTVIDRLQYQATIMILGVLTGSFFQQVVHALATHIFI